jgi:hypothetical protein
LTSSQFRDDREESRESTTTKVLVWTFIVMAIAVSLGLALARFGGELPVIGPLFGGPDTTTTSEVSVAEIQELNQLATTRWIGQVVVEEEAAPGRVENLAEAVGIDASGLTGESVLLVATGEVEAGVNLEELGQDDVRVNEDTVTINLPEAEVFSSSLDEDRTGVYDRDRGVFVFGVNEELADEARREAVSEIEDSALENGILEEAGTSAEDSIRAFVESLGFKEVRFE